MSTVSRHICHRVSTICCLYLHEDSNFGIFRIPHIYAYAHKWLQHQTQERIGYFRIHRTHENAQIWNHRASKQCCQVRDFIPRSRDFLHQLGCFWDFYFKNSISGFFGIFQNSSSKFSIQVFGEIS